MKQKVFALLALLALSCKAEHNAAPSSKQSVPVATDAAARMLGAPALPRLIIRTAEVSLIVGDTTASVEKLATLASANGGYLTDSKIWRDGQVVRATLTIRVPAPKLDADRQRGADDLAIAPD